MSLVEVPRAPAGEEPADITGFPPLPIEDYCNAQAAIPLKQQTNHCPPKPLWDMCSSQISTQCLPFKSRSLLRLLGPWMVGRICKDVDLTASCAALSHRLCALCTNGGFLLLSESLRYAWGDAVPRAEISAAAGFGHVPSSPESVSEMLSLGIIYFLSTPAAYRVALGQNTVCKCGGAEQILPSGLDCLKMYVCVLQMLCFSHDCLQT